MELHAAIYVDNCRVARSFNAHQPIARRSDPIEVHLPDLEILLAGGDDGVLHVQLLREALDRAPARVRMLDVGRLVQLEELELAVRQPEEPAPAFVLQTEPAVLLHGP